MICEKNKCTGCFACFNICPKNAIEMQEDEYGNIYPIIDKAKCINCGLCKKTCPQLNEMDKFNNPIETFAIYNKNLKKRLESSSGGVASLFYEYIINNCGVAYGVSSLIEDKFKFVRVDKMNELVKLKGSKYVHCYVDEAFKKVKKDLNKKSKVLFIGTPCQIAGLKSFLKNEYENLFTVDIVCHGVSNQKLLYENFKCMNIDLNKIKKISFRDSNLYNLKLIDNTNNVVFEKQADKIHYYRNFLQGNTYRENCYSCKYAKKERISDITIGDFWGLSKDSIIFDNNNSGVSLLIINTQKGKSLFENIKGKCRYEKKNFGDASKYNMQLCSPMKKSKKYYIFKNNYKKLGYKKTMKKMLSFKEKIIFFIKNNDMLYKMIKNVKNIIEVNKFTNFDKKY